jgi:hypothetical protein
MLSYRITLPVLDKGVSFKTLDNKLNGIEGLQSYAYALTSNMWTMIVLIENSDDTLEDYVNYTLNMLSNTSNKPIKPLRQHLSEIDLKVLRSSISNR